MIFVSGIHGAGKTHFCNIVKKELGINSYSASQLIAAKGNKEFTPCKFVSDVDNNQKLLIKAIDELRRDQKDFILDGHFCLLNNSGEITKIPYNTFELLKPDIIILLTEKADIIAERRFWRDGVKPDVLQINVFQNAEKEYAYEIAKSFQIPFIISGGAEDLKRIIGFIRTRG